jgi:thioredoxin reductase (NADPH)
MPEQVIIAGSGPAGLTAAIYTARANLEPLVIDGSAPGGQLMTTTEVENYPGFEEGITGPELMQVMRKQAERFGARYKQTYVKSVDLSDHPFKIEVEDETLETQTFIIATGASARLLGLESEKKLMGHGVSTCATCDGAFFRDKTVTVVGGGDSAMEESTFLTRFAKKVYVVHRRDELRASKIMQDRAKKNDKIEFIWDTVVDEIFGVDKGKVTGVRLKNVKSEDMTEMDIDGVFIAIGHTPNTGFLEGEIDLDKKGYVVCKPCTSHTSVEGVFAAGDLMDPVYKQAVTAAGLGCRAALDAEHYLESLND